MRALLMPVGDDWYAIGAERVREVTPHPRPTRLPGVPAGVLGVISVRGEIVPVFDTAALLGLDVAAPATFAVIVRTPDGPAALTATAIPEMVSLDNDLGPSDLAGSSARYRFGSRLVVMLDIDTMLAIARGEPVQAGGAR